jgi:hypothetical protein
VVVADPKTTFEGFSISHAAILDGTDGSELADGDIYGVREGSLDVDMDSYDNTGDDGILSSWHWFNYANVSITAGYIPFKLMPVLYGADMASSGSGATAQYEVPFLNEDMLNRPTLPMLIRIPSKNADGEVRILDAVLYKVQFMPMSFDGPSYKDGLVTNFSGRAVLSLKDEAGNTLAKRAIGRLINSAPAA